MGDLHSRAVVPPSSSVFAGHDCSGVIQKYLARNSIYIIGSIVDFNSKLYFSPFDDRPVYGGFGPHSVRQTSRVGLYTSKSTNKAAPFISANRQITATNTRLLNIGRRHTGSNNSPEEILGHL